MENESQCDLNSYNHGIRKVKPVNTSTGSVEVDGLELKLGDTDMDVNKEEDAELLELARDNSDMEEGDGTT
jgi:hypothetical protein